MIQEVDFVSWLAFPKVPDWERFAPELEVALRPESDVRFHQDVLRPFETGSLAQAVRFLWEQPRFPLVYRALPQLMSDADVEAPACTHELCWPVACPQHSRPVKIREASRSVLWSERRRRQALFALEGPRGRGGWPQLTVGGSSRAACLESWLIVSRWIRSLLRIQGPGSCVPHEVCVPRIARITAEQEASERKRNPRIREVLLQAALTEGRKSSFNLSGRGHEARVSLCVRLAAIVRGIELPSVYLSGYGPNNFYPYRVMARAAEELEKEFSRAVLNCNGHKMYVNEE